MTKNTANQILIIFEYNNFIFVYMKYYIWKYDLIEFCFTKTKVRFRLKHVLPKPSSKIEQNDTYFVVKSGNINCKLLSIL